MRIHNPILRSCMTHKLAVLGIAAIALLVSFGMIAPHLGSEFVPRLSEGSIVINVIRLAGIDLEESIRYNTRMEKALLKAFPDEVTHVWSRIGSAEVATDPMGSRVDRTSSSRSNRGSSGNVREIRPSLRELIGERTPRLAGATAYRSHNPSKCG